MKEVIVLHSFNMPISVLPIDFSFILHGVWKWCTCYNDITKTGPCNIQQFFHGCKNDNFQMKIFDIFLILAQNINCGYTLEPPQ